MKLVLDNIIFSLQKSGGGSVYWTELIKRFSTMNDDTVFFDQKEPNDNIFRKTIDLKNVKKESKWSLAIRRYLPFTEKISGKYIFHSSYYRYASASNAINVTSIHDFTTEKFRKGLAREVNLLQKKWAVKKAKGVVCISENTKKDLLFFMPNTDENKIRVIYNGVSNDFFNIPENFEIAEKDERFSDLENQKYLLYIGHRTSYKNFNFAVEAASKFKENLKLVVVGEPFTDEEKVYVESLLDHNYLQLNKLNNENLNHLYNKAFALLYPSSYEGFGIPIIEAMKTKCPVIAFKNSSIPEVAGEAALLYEEENVDSIIHGIQKLQDKDLRDRLKNKGIIQAEKFSWDNTFRQYIEFYKELYEKN
jgi:mannosyltransferase